MSENRYMHHRSNTESRVLSCRTHLTKKTCWKCTILCIFIYIYIYIYNVFNLTGFYHKEGPQAGLNKKKTYVQLEIFAKSVYIHFLPQCEVPKRVVSHWNYLFWQTTVNVTAHLCSASNCSAWYKLWTFSTITFRALLVEIVFPCPPRWKLWFLYNPSPLKLAPGTKGPVALPFLAALLMTQCVKPALRINARISNLIYPTHSTR